VKIAFFGDVVGRAGRKAITQYVPRLKGELGLDAVIVNAENAAGGFGITRATADELFEAGVDVLTLGNHSFDNPQGINVIETEDRLLRPCNYPQGTVPGRGAGLYTINGFQLLVVNVLGRVFMDALDDPFQAVDKEINAAPLGTVADATHQHVPTSDTRIWPNGTAYQTDAGMCGDYNSVIGMDKEEPLHRFTTRMRAGRFTPAAGPPTLCGIFVETDNATGLAVRAEPIRIGAMLTHK